MKDLTTDKKLQSIDQDEFDSFRQTKSNTNADIDYLLTFVDIKQKQQQKIVRNQQQQNCILDAQAINEYIKQNSSKQSESIEDRSNLISFIDLGLRMINRVKALMVKKKPQLKNGLKPNKLNLLKDLFFPTNNSKQKQIKNKKQQSNISGQSKQSQQMRKMRIQRQLDMLLHRVQIRKQRQLENYKYLLTISLYQQSQSIQKQQQDKQQPIIKLINQLQILLDKLQTVKNKCEKNSNNLVQQQKIVLLNNVWEMIDQLETKINCK